MIPVRGNYFFMDNTTVTVTVEKKVEGDYKIKRILMIILIVLLYLFPFYLFLIYPALSWVIFIIVPVWVAFMAKGLQPFLFSFVQWSFIYDIRDMGEVTFFKRIGGRKPKPLATSRIKEWKEIAPLTEEAREKIKACQNVYWLAQSEIEIGEMDYYALFDNEAGESCAVVLEAPDKTVGIFRFYNRGTVAREPKA